MNLVAIDVDPTTLQMRSRDTELLPEPEPPGEWSAWEPLDQNTMPTAYWLTFLAASQLGGQGSVTVTLNVEPDGTLIRTIDYQVRTIQGDPK